MAPSNRRCPYQFILLPPWLPQCLGRSRTESDLFRLLATQVFSSFMAFIILSVGDQFSFGKMSLYVIAQAPFSQGDCSADPEAAQIHGNSHNLPCVQGKTSTREPLVPATPPPCVIDGAAYSVRHLL